MDENVEASHISLTEFADNTPASKLKQIKGNPAAAAIPLLDAFISLYPDDDEAYTIRGIKHWAMGHRALAINDYLAAIRINPESRAKMALQAANSILDYYNKDLLNP